MKKLLIAALCFILNTQTVAASSWPSISPKRVKDAVALASGILSIPCFKTCFDLQNEHNSLLKSVLPNFQELFANECKQQSFFTHSSTYTYLWRNFLKKNVASTHPQVMQKLDTLDIKAGLFLVAGILLTTATLLCVIDNYVPKKSKPA